MYFSIVLYIKIEQYAYNLFYLILIELDSLRISLGYNLWFHSYDVISSLAVDRFNTCRVL